MITQLKRCEHLADVLGIPSEFDVTRTLTRAELRWFVTLRDTGDVFLDQPTSPRRSTVNALCEIGLAYELTTGRLCISERGRFGKVLYGGRIQVPVKSHTGDSAQSILTHAGKVAPAAALREMLDRFVSRVFDSELSDVVYEQLLAAGLIEYTDNSTLSKPEFTLTDAGRAALAGAK